MNCFSSVICVDNFTLFLSTNGVVFSIGRSEYKTHGHKKKTVFPLKQIKNLTNIKMISCGDLHTMFLNSNGDVYSLGSNTFGILGIGKGYNELKQTHIPQKINIPPCTQVSCGYNFTMCLTEFDRLYSFGDNYKGQLGLGNYKSYYSPQLIPDLNNIEYAVCGKYHSICKTYDNCYYSWGDNEYGQLGQGNNEYHKKPIQCLNWPDNIISIKCGSEHSLLLTSEGQVYSFGGNIYGKLGLNDKNIYSINIPTLIKDIPEIQRIECGNSHSMCIDINNNLWLFGNNTFGQFGYNNRHSFLCLPEKIRYKPIKHPTLFNIIDISSGGDHTFVKTIDNKIYAFGKNSHSQLGIKTPEGKQFTPIQVFIDKEDIWGSNVSKSTKAKSARK